ncbi:tRNA (adenosine(37)-N6)-dimethylallyltransferase MiaA [Actinopolyspora mortivallis]|uniref:tRNA dimethylallyltransferase n=1 Tax=Actinopolyspora mortivallis TaxID=33906 RepID=A0A2T0H105_ACTMO|nr:tRNA (adenosine(37)-N6)-dimethylallyltransferase MiaA [Actinopolyspora mortivallis]PRW65032.1 tRNA (adenosine(37)-N6)-dimethylallyltransferase MiaA [Actinopolyspora mortivallis]
MMPCPLAVVGPTATGKSELALRLAERCGGEIVNADAMQLYRGMDIGTAKTPPELRRGVAHHQLDVLDVTENASVAAYQRQARETVERLLREDVPPVIVGGSGLYVQALLDELNFPGTDPAVRARWEERLQLFGSARLHRELAELDPPAAESIPRSNGRRLVRALEVIEITGRRFSANLPEPGPPRYGTVLVGLDRPVAELDRRVNRRVAEMFDAGLVTEVRRLARAGLRRGRTASRALGYQQVLAELDSSADMSGAAAETARLTRKFVRRQRSWFRRDKRIHWVQAGASDLENTVLRLWASGCSGERLPSGEHGGAGPSGG